MNRISSLHGYISFICITTKGRGYGAMPALKVVELVVAVGTAIFATVKAVAKLISHVNGK
jgi:hypothetical protein